MLFHSTPFLVLAAAFFPVLLLLERLKRPPLIWAWIVAASLVFYGWWRPPLVALLVATALVHYLLALQIERDPRRKDLWLVVSILVGVGTIGAYKYLHVDAWPVGLSFYTFSALSYTIDVHRGQLAPTRDLLLFTAYLSLFPKLLAGPVARAKPLMAQLIESRTPTSAERWQATRQIAAGFFKKMVLADNLAVIVNAHYAAAPEPSAALWWLVAFCFAVQMYCDFSGYSDIAIGLGRFMGLDFGENFRHPFAARNIREFWNRWHMSISAWFRDYLHYPLNRRWPTRRGLYATIVITFLASGLWHAATWTFALWGFLLGAFMVLELVTRWDRKLARVRGGAWIATPVVCLVFFFTAIVFRSTSIDQLLSILAIMFSFRSGASFELLVPVPDWLWLIVAAAVLFELRHSFGWDRLDRKLAAHPAAVWGQGLVVIATAVACLELGGPALPFIYFAF